MSLSAAVAAIVVAGFAAPAAATAPDADVSGEYLMVRRVTSDNGWFGLPAIDDTTNFVHEARTYEIAVVGEVVDGAAELAITSRYFDEDPRMAGDPFEAALVDGRISFVNVVEDVCLSTVTGEYDGPPEATLTSTLDVTLSKVEDIFSGTFTYTAETVASEACEPEDIGYTADAWLIHADAEQAPGVAGVYAGQFVRDEQAWNTEYSVRECEPGEGCELVVRYEQTVTHADGVTSQRFIDIFMLETGDGDYVGGAVYSAGCASDLDGSFIAEDAYDVRVSAFAAFYDIGGGERAVTIYKEEAGTPSKSDADVAARCGPFVNEDSFAGLPLGREADWSAESSSAVD